MINQFLAHTSVFFIEAALASAFSTWLALKFLRRRAILDLPNARSSHTIPTPRGGGWGVMIALAPFWLWATWRSGSLNDPSQIALILGAILLMVVSWIDDRKGLGAALRLGVQLVAAGVVMVLLPRDLSLTSGLLPMPLDRILAMLAWLWFVNLFNFMDGIDGLAGGSAAAMGFGIMLVSLRHGPTELEAFRGAMLAAVSVGFLVWNWQPAKIFMGDVGSIPLGYLLGFELVRLAMDGGQIAALIIALYYLADATITLVKRARRGERVWEAHREHYYQRSTQLGRGHGPTARTAILAQLALAIFAWLGLFWGLWLVAPAALLVALLLRWMATPPRTP